MSPMTTRIKTEPPTKNGALRAEQETGRGKSGLIAMFSVMGIELAPFSTGHSSMTMEA